MSSPDCRSERSFKERNASISSTWFINEYHSEEGHERCMNEGTGKRITESNLQQISVPLAGSSSPNDLVFNSSVYQPYQLGECKMPFRLMSSEFSRSMRQPTDGCCFIAHPGLSTQNRPPSIFDDSTTQLPNQLQSAQFISGIAFRETNLKKIGTPATSSIPDFPLEAMTLAGSKRKRDSSCHMTSTFSNPTIPVTKKLHTEVLNYSSPHTFTVLPQRISNGEMLRFNGTRDVLGCSADIAVTGSSSQYFSSKALCYPQMAHFSYPQRLLCFCKDVELYACSLSKVPKSTLPASAGVDVEHTIFNTPKEGLRTFVKNLISEKTKIMSGIMKTAIVQRIFENGQILMPLRAFIGYGISTPAIFDLRATPKDDAWSGYFIEIGQVVERSDDSPELTLRSLFWLFWGILDKFAGGVAVKNSDLYINISRQIALKYFAVRTQSVMGKFRRLDLVTFCLHFFREVLAQIDQSTQRVQRTPCDSIPQKHLELWAKISANEQEVFDGQMSNLIPYLGEPCFSIVDGKVYAAAIPIVGLMDPMDGHLWSFTFPIKYPQPCALSASKFVSAVPRPFSFPPPPPPPQLALSHHEFPKCAKEQDLIPSYDAKLTDHNASDSAQNDDQSQAVARHEEVDERSVSPYPDFDDYDITLVYCLLHLKMSNTKSPAISDGGA